jgi:hypothetical protein
MRVNTYSEFSIRPVRDEGSPLDVAGADTDVTADEILAAIREGRARERGGGSD